MVRTLQSRLGKKHQVLKLVFMATLISIVGLGLYITSFVSIEPVAMSQLTKDSMRPRPVSQFGHWIVITTVAPPTADVMHMASLPGWRIVVVGDEKTPKNWSYPNCVYLSLSDQSALGFELTARLPVRSYSRKNLGYLYAVLHGAKVIFDTDDDNRPLDSLKSFAYSPKTAGLVVDNQDRNVFNPYHHFGQSTLWPRGFPLTAINNQRSYGLYRLSAEVRTPIIQQGIVAGDPDLDAIFRITRKGVAPVFDVTYDPVSPAVFLPAGTYSPFNSQNTFFLHKAFWALFLPTTTAFRVCDIWRGYWAQRLAWEIGGSLGFPAANAYQSRNAHSYLDDALEETQMYFQTERLLDFLSSWVCPKHLSFFECVQRLSWDMSRENFWGEKDAENIELWIKDLLSVGYPEPERVVSVLRPCKRVNSSSLFLSNTCKQPIMAGFNDAKSSPFLFFPTEHKAPSLDVHKENSFSSLTIDLRRVIEVCPRLTKTPVRLQKIPEAMTFFQDVLLIITFNFPHYPNLRFIEAAYRSTFLNIAYCGSNVHLFQHHMHDIGRNLTLIEASLDKGSLGYICILKAITAGFRVAGYLVTGDDVLLNFWSFNGFNKTNIWMTTDAIFPLLDKDKNWIWWTSKYGQRALTKAKYELAKVKPPPGIISPQEHREMTRQNSGAEGTVFRGMSDTYYVPARFAPHVKWYLSLFLKHRVFLEIAVPVVMYGLQPREMIEKISETIALFASDPSTSRILNEVITPITRDLSYGLDQLVKLDLPSDLNEHQNVIIVSGFDFTSPVLVLTSSQHKRGQQLCL
ncbi:hypothetical protein RRG08_059595 [Elysia crispata]|uniref:DUF288 domain-containing protein n=1 Tax=Elysia crispata TaxID=231223 RepID=A0AAE0YJ13_9GAST|nr:hypothetical protein RRG08_059595 [Elysia crispata]